VGGVPAPMFDTRTLSMPMFDNIDYLLGSTPGRIVFDAANVELKAFDALVGQGYEEREMIGDAIREQLQKTEFEGLTGIVSFDETGGRTAAGINQQIMNLQEIIILNEKNCSWFITPSDRWKDINRLGCQLSSGEMPWKWEVVGKVHTGNFNLNAAIRWPKRDASELHDLHDPCEAGTHYKGFYRGRELLFSWNVSDKTLEKTENEKFCQPCEPGRRQDAVLFDATPCARCGDAGLYAPTFGARTCTLCEAAKFQNTLGSSFCHNCSAGTYSLSGASKCERCPKGTYRDQTSPSCIACNKSTFAATMGSSACRVCPQGQATENIASENEEDCGCPESYFFSNKCESCPQGMTCSFGSRADNIARMRSPRPEVNPGFYTTWSFPLEVYECFKNKDVCEGDLPETCSTKRYGLLCHDCPTGFYRSGNDCKTCSAQIPILIVLCVVCIGFILAFYFKGNSPLVSEVRGSQIALLVLQQMFAIVQLFALFNTLQTKLPNSSFASKALGATDVLLLDPSAFRLECISHSNIVQYSLQGSIFPTITLLMFACLYLSRLLVSSKIIPKSKSMSADKIVNTLFTINQGLLISFANVSLSAFQCFNHPNNKSTLFPFPNTECYEAGHEQFLVVSVFMIATVLVPFNVVFLYAIYILHKHRANDEVAIRLLIRFKCFFSKWRPACWYWGYVLCVRQQLLTCTLSFFSDDIWAQMFWVIILVFAISVACAFVEPWLILELCVLDVFLHLCLVATIFCASVFNEPTENEQRFEMISGFIVVFMMIAFCIYEFRVVVTLRVRASAFVSYPKQWCDEEFDEHFLSVGDLVQQCKADRVRLWSEALSERERREFQHFFASLRVALPASRNEHRIFVPPPSYFSKNGNLYFEFQRELESKRKSVTQESYI